MALLDEAAQNASLDNDYGASRGPNAPAAHQVALFDGDPLLGGLELTSAGGYARVTVTNNGTNWPAAASGAKTSAAVTFPTSSGAWSSTATHWVLYDDADGTTAWDSAPLDDEIDINEAGDTASTTLTVYYDGGL
jgi:hypothetical protein